MRYQEGRTVVLEHEFLDDETVLDPGAVTVTVTNEAGEVVATAGQ